MTTTSKTSDFRIGCHLSASEGYLSMAKTAVQIGANTFQFFTRNPRGGTAKPIDPEDVSAFLEYSEQNDIGPILAHASYTCLLYTSDAADDLLCVDLGGRRTIKKKKTKRTKGHDR